MKDRSFLCELRTYLIYVKLGEYKYLSWVYGVDRKICHEGHWSASRGLPSDAEEWSRVTDFSIHTIHPW